MSHPIALIGGPRDGEFIRVREYHPTLTVAAADPEQRRDLSFGESPNATPSTMAPYRTVTYRLEEYFRGRELLIAAYVMKGIDRADALWDVLGLVFAQEDEKKLPAWITTNRRRLAGRLWDLAEQQIQAIYLSGGLR